MLLNQMLAAGFKLPHDDELIVSMSEAREGCVVIVTDRSIYEARSVPSPQLFEVRLVHHI